MKVRDIMLSSKIKKLLNDMEEYSRTHDGIWSIPREEGEYLYQLIIEENPKSILELGTSIGYSTIWLGLAAQEIGAQVLTVDNDPKKAAAAIQNITQAGLSEIITVRLGNAADILKELIAENKNFEFIFMDTNKEDYLSHFKLANKILVPNGLLAADNVLDQRDRMLDFLDYVENNPKFQTELIRIGNGVELVRKS